MTSSAATFGELEGRVLTLFGAGNFDAALELARRTAAAHPHRVAFTVFWTACILGAKGEPAEALRALTDAVDRTDVWWGRALLEDDPDLRGLREVSGFDELVDECDRRGRAAREAARVEWEHIPHATPSARRTVLVALHGRTGNLEDLRERWTIAAERGTPTVVVQSSQMLAQGMHCWDDAGTAARDLEEVAGALHVPDDGIVLAGFSQGGATAARAALAGEPVRARGFVAVAPGFLRSGLAGEDLVPLVPSAAARGVRGWMAVGDDDKRYGPPALEVARALEEAGLRVEVSRMTRRGHEYPEPFGEALDDAIAFVLGATSSIAP